MILTTLIDTRNLKLFKDMLPPGAQSLADSVHGIAVGAIERVGAENTACGAAAADFSEGEMTIASVYVTENMRRRGIGTLLADALFDAAEALGTISRVTCPVAPGSDGMEEFLSDYGFLASDDSVSAYEVPLDDAGELLSSLARRGGTAGVRPLSTTSPQMIAAFNKQIDELGVFPEPIDKNRLDGDVSTVYAPSGEIYGAATFVPDRDNKTIVFESAYMTSATATAFSAVLAAAAGTMREKYGGKNYKLRFTTVTSDTSRLASTLLKSVPSCREFRLRVMCYSVA